MYNSWNRTFGFASVPGQPYTAPIWVGEFGTCTHDNSCFNDVVNGNNSGYWFNAFTTYMDNGDPSAGVPGGMSWSYWPINGAFSDSWSYLGPSSTQTWRSCYGQREDFGLLGGDWSTTAAPYVKNFLFASSPTPSPPATNAAITTASPSSTPSSSVVMATATTTATNAHPFSPTATLVPATTPTALSLPSIVATTTPLTTATPTAPTPLTTLTPTVAMPIGTPTVAATVTATPAPVLPLVTSTSTPAPAGPPNAAAMVMERTDALSAPQALTATATMTTVLTATATLTATPTISATPATSTPSPTNTPTSTNTTTPTSTATVTAMPPPATHWSNFSCAPYAVTATPQAAKSQTAVPPTPTARPATATPTPKRSAKKPALPMPAPYVAVRGRTAQGAIALDVLVSGASKGRAPLRDSHGVLSGHFYYGDTRPKTSTLALRLRVLQNATTSCGTQRHALLMAQLRDTKTLKLYDALLRVDIAAKGQTWMHLVLGKSYKANSTLTLIGTAIIVCPAQTAQHMTKKVVSAPLALEPPDHSPAFHPTESILLHALAFERP